MQKVDRTLIKEELDALVGLIDEKNISRRLSYIYEHIPMNHCRRCSNCCFNSPQVHPIEFLNILAYMRTLSESAQVSLANKIIEFEMLHLTTLKNKCPFIGKRGCRIYKERPLQCRIFGLYPRDEYEKIKAGCRAQNQLLAEYYRQEKDLQLPKPVMTYDIDQCRNNQSRDGTLTVVPARERDRFNEQIFLLSEQFLPRRWLSPNLISLSNQYNRLFIDDDMLENIKVGAIREYQKDGHSRTLKSFLTKDQFVV